MALTELEACDKLKRKGGCETNILSAGYGGVTECEDECIDGMKGCAGFMYNKRNSQCQFVSYSEYEECSFRTRPDVDYYNCLSRKGDDSSKLIASMATAMVALFAVYN